MLEVGTVGPLHLQPVGPRDPRVGHSLGSAARCVPSQTFQDGWEARKGFSHAQQGVFARLLSVSHRSPNYRQGWPGLDCTRQAES